jgi:pantoate--beta-alanine ligase
MYPKYPPYRTYVDPLEANDSHEGTVRPNFFRGVATVVTKLFTIVRPTVAAFGQKDAYQCVVIRQLVRDLNLSPDVRIVATVRERDGLAMSSRNAYLTPEQRAAAPALYQALQATAQGIHTGEEWHQSRVLGRAQAILDAAGQFRKIEYLAIACALTGRPVRSPSEAVSPTGALMLSVAAPIGQTRLIDNIVVVPGRQDLTDQEAADFLGRPDLPRR